jgi:hypothetical protein
MTRTSKQEERRAVSPRKRRYPKKKTGPLKDALPEGYKVHANVSSIKTMFIPKIK